MDILKGEIIILRAIEHYDLDIIHKWENDSSIWQISNTIAPFSKHVIKQFIDNSQYDIFTTKQLRLMIDKENGETIGTVDLFDFEPLAQGAVLGILIALKENRNKGYASDTLDVIIKYCFTTLQLHQLYCNITEDNSESINLFTKKGFKLIGAKKEWFLFSEGNKDEAMYQLINNVI